MAAIRRTDTKPEVALRRLLHARGLRFRKDFRLDLPGVRVRPDVVFTKRKVAVFVDSCFWHVCPEHGREPTSNEWYWSPKLRRNLERDREQDAILSAAGWTVIRVWEHVPVEEAAAMVQAAWRQGEACTGPSETDVAAKWQEMAPLIDRMMERVGTEVEFPVAPGSSLAGDDKASDPYHVSHVVRMCLTAGVDHLHAVKVLVVDRGVLHVAAPSSLSRGALENFATAYWILGPNQRADRISRALRSYAKNFKDSDTATKPLGPPTHKPLEPKMKKLRGRRR